MIAAKLLESIPLSVRVMRKFYVESFEGGLTLQQYRVLSLIKDAQGQTQIAETLQVSLAAISKMINSMEVKKLITRKAGPDRRTLILKLTPKGKAMVDRVRKNVQEQMDKGIEKLSKQDKEQLMQGLTVLDRLMQKLKEV